MEKEEVKEEQEGVFILVQGEHNYAISEINRLHAEGYFPFGNMTSVVIQDQIIHTQLLKK